jgi:hypothetical protein
MPRISAFIAVQTLMGTTATGALAAEDPNAMHQAVPEGDVTIQKHASGNAIAKAEEIANCGANGERPSFHPASSIPWNN